MPSPAQSVTPPSGFSLVQSPPTPPPGFNLVQPQPVTPPPGFSLVQPKPATPTTESLWGKISGAISDIAHNPSKAVSFVFGTNPEVTEAAAKQFQKPGLSNKIVGGAEWLASGVPWAGADIARGMQEAGQGNYKQSAIHTAEGAAQAALLPVAGEKLAGEIAGHEAEEFLPQSGEAIRKALNVKTAPVPAESGVGKLLGGQPAPEVHVVGSEAEKAEIEHAAEVERPENGQEAEAPKTAKIVSPDHVPVVSKDEILSQAVQNTVDNSKILRTAGLDPGEIYSSADVEKQLNSAADALKSNLDTRATTPLTFPMQKQLAADLGMSVEDLLSRKSGTAFNAEEVSAARALLKESQTRVMNVARLAATGDEDYIRQFNEALAQHKTVLDVVKGRVAKEAGRALGAFRIAQEDLPSARLSDLMAKLDPKAAKRAAELISHTDPNDASAVNKLIAEIEPSSTKEKVFEAWQNALLCSPKTAIIKAASDTTMLVLDTLAKAASGVMAQGKAILTGDTPERYALDSWSFAKGAADAIGKAGKTLFGVAPDDLDISFEHRPTYAIKGVVGKVVRVPMTVLSRITDAVATLNYAGQLNVLAYRQALGEGLTGQELEARAAQLASSPTPEMRQTAFGFAKKQTFQADLGKTGKAFQRWVRSTPGLRYLFPFIKTPLNIVKAAAEYSPGGLVKGLATGNIDLAGRGAVGSAIAAAIAYHTLQGNIVGGGPVTPAKKYSLEDTGWQPYSLHIGNKYFSYDRLEPLGMVIGMTADLVHAIDKGEDPTSATVESRATQIQEAIMRNLESLPFMYSVSNLMQAFSPDNKNGIRNFLSRQASSLVPAVVAQTAQAIDRTVRSPQNVGQRIEARIPGLTGNVPPELNVAGQPVKRPANQVGGMNPFPATTETTDPALRELGALGETAIHAPQTATEPRAGLHLRQFEKAPRAQVTPEESRILQQQDEQQLHSWLVQQMESPEWKTLTPDEKRSAIKKERAAITRSRWNRLQTIREHGGIALSGGETSLAGRP